MTWFIILCMILGGIVVMYAGAELLVRGAAFLVLKLGITPLIIGLTVVAFSTSSPEFVGSLVAQIQGKKGDLSIGNVIGSGIANIGLILGISTLFYRLPISSTIKKQEMIITMASTLLLWLFMLSGGIGRIKGGVLFLGSISYIIYQIFLAKRGLLTLKDEEIPILKEIEKRKRDQPLFNVVLVIVGVVILVIGAYLLINGAIELATLAGISERVIALTVVALGTSLPELATTLVAGMRQQCEIALGNIIGSNILNHLFVAGLVAFIIPIQFAPKFIYQDMPVLVGFTCVLWLFMFRQQVFARWNGPVLLAGYALYLIFIV